MPLQTYDRTVSTTPGKVEDAILAYAQVCKRSIRSGLKKGKAEGITFHEDTANAMRSSTSTTPSWKRPPSAMVSVLTLRTIKHEPAHEAAHENEPRLAVPVRR